MTRKLSNFFISFLLVVPDLAFAHTPIKGANSFYNGALHPVVVPSHLLLLVALGLFFGQRRLEDIEPALKFSLAAVVLGLGASWYSLAGAAFEIVILVIATIIGLLIAASPRIPIYWYAIIGAAAGFSLGLDSAQEALSGKEKFIGLFGSACGIYFFSIYPIAFSIYCSKKSWLQIGVRILGSWIAASALLVLALSMTSVIS
jgi:hydrogenase/urease accessory protein HupE